MGPVALALENIVDQRDRRPEVTQRIGHALAAFAGHHSLVASDDRVEEHGVETLVELHHRPVPGLQGIIKFFIGSEGLRVGGWRLRRASAEGEHGNSRANKTGKKGGKTWGTRHQKTQSKSSG